MSARSCWAATLPGAGPCDGRLVKAHLIPAQLLRREFRHGAYRDAAGRLIPVREEATIALDDLVWDARAWVWMCGGPTGVGGHHGRLDYSRRLRIPRHRIPAGTEEFAAELGLGWWLDRTYGERKGEMGFTVSDGEARAVRVEEDAAKARTAGLQEAAFELGRATGEALGPSRAAMKREQAIETITEFLELYEDDMHREARGEPFEFASREHAAETLFERLGRS